MDYERMLAICLPPGDGDRYFLPFDREQWPRDLIGVVELRTGAEFLEGSVIRYAGKDYSAGAVDDGDAGDAVFFRLRSFPFPSRGKRTTIPALYGVDIRGRVACEVDVPAASQGSFVSTG